MEEFEYKLAQSNPVLVHKAVNSLVNKIKVLNVSNNQKDFEKYLRYLRDKCFYEKTLISTTAMLGLLSISQGPNPIITVDTLLTDALAALSQDVNLSGIIELIFHILFETNNNINYGIIKNQHPLITLLKKDQNCWPHLVSKIHETFREQPRAKVLARIRPFALYVLYDNEKKMDPLFQLDLLKIYKLNIDQLSMQKIIVLNQTHLMKSARFCKILFSTSPLIVSYLLLIIQRMFEMNISASDPLWVLHDQLLVNDKADFGPALILLANCLSSCPIVNLETLMEIAIYMLKVSPYQPIVYDIIKSSLLIWKLHFSSPTNFLNTAVENKLDRLLQINGNVKKIERNFDNTTFLNEPLYLNAWFMNNKIKVEFLGELLNVPDELLKQMFAPLLGIFYETNQVTEISLKLLIKCCEIDNQLSTRLLPVVLNKIANCVEPSSTLLLFKALPQLAMLKENLASILSTIKALSKITGAMHAFAISLFYQLVVIDKRNFPYLHELIVRESDDNKQELIIAKTYVVKEICRQNIGLEVFGTELTAFLSKVLNTHKEDSVVITYAFEGLKYLCEYDILDLASTVSNLEPIFKNDPRNTVAIGLCGILALMANYTGYGNESNYEQMMELSIKKLWEHTLSDNIPEVYEAAYKSISAFSMEQIALGFPPAYVKVSKDESIHGCIAGACWVNLLLYGNKKGLKPATDMLIEFISNDMRNYKRKVLETSEGHQEPLYMPLSRDSVLAAVAKFVKRNSTVWQQIDKDIYLQALRILSFNYNKPLPPMDWSFLQLLKDAEEMQEYCVTIASHQSSISNSARKFMESYINAVHNKNILDQSALYVYKNLEFLFNSMQPVILKPFFKKTLKTCLDNLPQHENDLNLINDSINGQLANKLALEPNKNTIAEVVLGLIENLEHDTKEFQKLTSILGNIPSKYLNEFSPVQFESVSLRVMYRCLVVRCAGAHANEDEPFQILDGLVDCRALKSKTLFFPTFDLFEQLFRVFNKHRSHKSLPGWLNELLTKIQLELAEHQDMRTVLFSCTLLVIAVVVASGYYVFSSNSKLSDFTECFPYSAAHLMDQKAFAPFVSQFLESLYDISTSECYKKNAECKLISNSFKHTLLLMRKHEKFNEKFRWMKYIEVSLN